jgi:hypothetical protein
MWGIAWSSESCYSHHCTEIYRVSFTPKYNNICDPDTDLVKYQQKFLPGIGSLTPFRQMLARLPTGRKKGSQILPPMNVSRIIRSSNYRYTCLQLLVGNMVCEQAMLFRYALRTRSGFRWACSEL